MHLVILKKKNHIVIIILFKAVRFFISLQLKYSIFLFYNWTIYKIIRLKYKLFVDPFIFNSIDLQNIQVFGSALQCVWRGKTFHCLAEYQIAFIRSQIF